MSERYTDSCSGSISNVELARPWIVEAVLYVALASQLASLISFSHAHSHCNAHTRAIVDCLAINHLKMLFFVFCDVYNVFLMLKS